MEVSVSSLLIRIEQVVSSVVAFLVLGEALPAIAIAGGVVAIGAIGMVIWRATRERRSDVAASEIAPP